MIDPSDDVVSFEMSGVEPTTTLICHGAVVSHLPQEVRPSASSSGGPTAPPRGLNTAATVRDAVDAVLSGEIVMFTSGRAAAARVPTGWAPTPRKAQVERVVRGPNDAFTHDLMTNMALVRNLAQTRDLRVRIRALGPDAIAKVAVAYVAGKADPAVLETVRERLARPHPHSPVDVTRLKPALVDDPLSPFVNVQLTERVDAVASALLAGGVAVFTTGSVEALIVPTSFLQMMASPEDRYLPRYLADADRLIRHIAAFLALTIEPTYIALASVNQDLLPTPLAFAIARARTGVPMPVGAEVVLMAIIVEVLREAAIRLPQILSQTISIVGALVIGQAIVQASLVSAPVTVLAAFSALASFTVPQYEIALAIRFLRFPGMLAAAVFGLFGVTVYYLIVMLHMAGLQSFGRPYLTPLAPRRQASLGLLVRVPPWLKARLA